MKTTERSYNYDEELDVLIRRRRLDMKVIN